MYTRSTLDPPKNVYGFYNRHNSNVYYHVYLVFKVKVISDVSDNEVQRSFPLFINWQRFCSVSKKYI